MKKDNIMNTQPAIGTPVSNDRYNGFIYGFEDASQSQMFLIGGQGMQKIEYKAKIVYLENGKGESLSECENLSLEKLLDEDREPASQAELDEYIAQANQVAADLRQSYRDRADAEKAARQAYIDEHREKVPVWAKGVIIAELHENKCDSQSDYYHSSSIKTVILGFSKHTRDIFSEMRKHAAVMPELADIIEAGSDAEHREKYSMGRGYYLTVGSTYEGWQVSKRSFDRETLNGLPEGEWLVDNKPEPPTTPPTGPKTGEGFTLSEGTKPGYIQIGFDEKPDADTRSELKAARFRWSRYNSVWYGKADALPARYQDASEAAPTNSACKTCFDVIETTSKEAYKCEKCGEMVDNFTPKPVNHADTLRTVADKMQDTIDNKLNPACGQQNPTPRRAAMAKSMRQDGEKLQEIQHILNSLADAHDAGTIAPVLKNVTNKATIETLLYLNRFGADRISDDQAARLGRVGINTAGQYAEALDALKLIIDGAPEIDRTAQEIKDAEDALIGCKIDGFFPTPPSVLNMMLEEAEQLHTDGAPRKILEPSAGNGAIAEHFRAAGYEVDLFEINGRLQDLLELKGFDITGGNFLEHEAREEYSLIVMNPPFEHCQDVDHIKHAFEMLKHGGRLIAIAGEGVFFRSGKKETAFREWLDEAGAEITDLEQAFKEKGAGRVRTTGARSRLIVIDK